MSFYDEILDASTGAYKVLQNGEWRVSSSGAHTSIANPSKGGVAFRVQGAQQAAVSACAARRASATREQAWRPRQGTRRRRRAPLAPGLLA